MRRHPERDDEEVALELRRLKPHITEQDAAEAVSIARAKILPLLQLIEETTAT